MQAADGAMAQGDKTLGGERNSGVPARSLSELLERHDVDFVRCAYVSLIGRLPDDEGLKFYSERLRLGYSKMHILRQLRHSEEGRAHSSDIPRLERDLRRSKWSESTLVGWLVRPFTKLSGGSALDFQLRRIENAIARLDEVRPNPMPASQSVACASPDVADVVVPLNLSRRASEIFVVLSSRGQGLS